MRESNKNFTNVCYAVKVCTLLNPRRHFIARLYRLPFQDGFGSAIPHLDEHRGAGL